MCPPQLNSRLKSRSTHQACPQHEARYPLGVGWPLGWLSSPTATPPLTMPRVPSCSWVAVSSCRHRWRAVACCFSSPASHSCAMLPQPLLPAGTSRSPGAHSLPVGLSLPVYLLAPKPAPLHLQDSAKPLCNCETGHFFTKQTFGTLYYVPLCRAQVNTANQHLG